MVFSLFSFARKFSSSILPALTELSGNIGLFTPNQKLLLVPKRLPFINNNPIMEELPQFTKHSLACNAHLERAKQILIDPQSAYTIKYGITYETTFLSQLEGAVSNLRHAIDTLSFVQTDMKTVLFFSVRAQICLIDDIQVLGKISGKLTEKDIKNSEILQATNNIKSRLDFGAYAEKTIEVNLVARERNFAQAINFCVLGQVEKGFLEAANNHTSFASMDAALARHWANINAFSIIGNGCEFSENQAEITAHEQKLKQTATDLLQKQSKTGEPDAELNLAVQIWEHNKKIADEIKQAKQPGQTPLPTKDESAVPS